MGKGMIVILRRLTALLLAASISLAILVLAVIWPKQGFAKDTETDPTDPSATACVNAYYGIGEAVNYLKAYKCFDVLHTYQMLILMQLNGQGVPADLGKAKALMDEWRKLHPNRTVGGLFPDGNHLLRILADKNAKVPATPALSYCKDVVTSNYEEGFCLRIEDDLEQQKSDKTFAKIRGTLSPEDAKLWDQMTSAFEEYVDAEGLRADNLYYGGSGAPNANTSQRIYIRKDFMELIQKVFIQKALVSSSKSQLEKSLAIMQAAFDDDLAKNGTISASEVSSDTEFDKKMEADGAVAYKSAAVDSQNKWLILRNLCAEMAARLYKGRKPGVDWEISLDNALTIDRTAVIKEPI